MHVFNDARFDFQDLRLLGSAASGDAEPGEVLSTGGEYFLEALDCTLEGSPRRSPVRRS